MVNAVYVAVLTEWACGNSKPAELDWGPGFITSPTTENSLCRWRFRAPVGKVEAALLDLTQQI